YGYDLPINTRAHPMLIRAPLAKTREIFEDLARVGMKDMGAILMDQDACFVVVIVGVPADVRTFVAKEHLFIRSTRQSLCQHATGEARSDNQIIKHINPQTVPSIKNPSKHLTD